MKKEVKYMIREQIKQAEEKAKRYNDSVKAPFELPEWEKESNWKDYKLQIGILIGMKAALGTAKVITYEEVWKIQEEIERIINIAYNSED